MVAPSTAAAARFLSAPPANVHGFLLYGTDSLQIAARAQRLAELLSNRPGPGCEIIRLYESDLAADPHRVTLELTSGSLFAGTKIVWLFALPSKAQPQLLEVVSAPLDGAFLIVQAPDLRKSHKTVQAFEGAPYLAAIGCYGEDRGSLISAIQQQIEEAGCKIGDDAAALIAARCDYSAMLARSEAGKLIAFAGGRGRISPDEVEACLADQQTAGLSEIVDAALEGETPRAVSAFDRFMAVEANPAPVLAVLSSALLRLHGLRTRMDTGISAAQAIKELKPPVFFRQQDALAAQLRLWTAGKLMAVL